MRVCSSCGQVLNANSRFCPYCGSPVPTQAAPVPPPASVPALDADTSRLWADGDRPVPEWPDQPGWQAPPPAGARHRRTLLILLTAGLVVLVGAGAAGAWWWFQRPPQDTTGLVLAAGYTDTTPAWSVSPEDLSGSVHPLMADSEAGVVVFTDGTSLEARDLTDGRHRWTVPLEPGQRGWACSTQRWQGQLVCQNGTLIGLQDGSRDTMEVPVADGSDESVPLDQFDGIQVFTSSAGDQLTLSGFSSVGEADWTTRLDGVVAGRSGNSVVIAPTPDQVGEHQLVDVATGGTGPSGETWSARHDLQDGSVRQDGETLTIHAADGGEVATMPEADSCIHLTTLVARAVPAEEFGPATTMRCSGEFRSSIIQLLGRTPDAGFYLDEEGKTLQLIRFDDGATVWRQEAADALISDGVLVASDVDGQLTVLTPR